MSKLAPEQKNSAAYEESLLEFCYSQWLFGDWERLAKIDRHAVQNHPDKAKIAIFIAAGKLQIGNPSEAELFIQLALEWGGNKKLINQILISGVYNSLGRAAAAGRQEKSALQFFENAVLTAMPHSDVKLLAQARSRHQFDLLGILKKEELLSFSPADRANYLNQNGEILYKEGKYKLALEFFERAFESAPTNAWYCQNIAEATARLGFKKNDQWECEQLGKSIDETGKWDVAVRHYRRALKLNSAHVEAHRKTQTFSVEPAQKGQLDHPIFIVGCGHSGTSLMLAILGNHPRIQPIPKESGLFLRTDAAIQKTMREWDADCSTQNKARWAEKTPPHIFQIHRFLAFRPKALFVLMLRDGRDVVCSLKPRVGYAAFEDRLDRWIYDNMAGLPYWQHPQVHVVKYEDLVADPEATLRTLCQFLGEDYSPTLQEYHKTEHRWYSNQIVKPDAIKTHSDHMNNRNWQINQPIFDGRGRWHAEMSQAEKDQFKNSPAQPLLQRFGYVENCNW